MILIRPTPRDEVQARWEKRRARHRTDRSQQPPPPRPQNVQQVLDLGSLVYFRWRGRTYGVPPLPWKDGAALLDAYLEAQNLGERITRKNALEYYKTLERMSHIMWRCSRPVGLVRRFLKKVKALRNPYLKASESEIGELAVFFLGCRMKTRPELQRTLEKGLPVPSDPSPTIS